MNSVPMTSRDKNGAELERECLSCHVAIFKWSICIISFPDFCSESGLMQLLSRAFHLKNMSKYIVK